MRRISGDVTLPDAPKAGIGTDRPAGLPHRYRIGDVIDLINNIAGQTNTTGSSRSLSVATTTIMTSADGT